MFNLGTSLAVHLKAGDLILVNGPLGAGKTVLAQGIGKGLGIDGITSPTFVISRTHKGVLPMITWMHTASLIPKTPVFIWMI